MIGFCLDRVIPFTFIIIQLGLVYLFGNKEWFRITLHNEVL